MRTANFEILILGSNSALPVKGRSPSAQVLNLHEQLFLVDCGEGTQFRLTEYRVKRSRIEHIFISHLHGDHIFGLPGLITSYNHSSRKERLTLHGPTGLDEFVNHALKLSESRLQFELVFNIIHESAYKLVYESDDISVHCIPLDHRIQTLGYIFKEKMGKHHLDRGKIERVDVKYRKELQEGTDVEDDGGNILRAEDFVEIRYKPRSYAYCSDTRYSEKLIPYLQGVDVLYHETTYLDELRDKAKETGHSTAKEAAVLAKKAGVGCLLTGHYSSRYEDLSLILEECQGSFLNTVLGIEGLRLPVPLKEHEIKS